MTMSHNKKRNTAFLFEVLLKEQTKAILDKKDSKAQFIESSFSLLLLSYIEN